MNSNTSLYRLITRKLNKTILLLLAGLLLITGWLTAVPLPAEAAGTTYYVAKNGLDTNPGTEAAPWLTIQKAADTLEAGDTVYVKNGIYSEYLFIGTSGPYTGNSGTASAPITYQAYPGHQPVIECATIDPIVDRPLVAIRALSNIVFDGFELRDNPYTYGLIITSGSSSITLRNLKIHNILKGGIITWGVDGLLIDSCEVYDTNHIVTSNEQVSLMPAYNFEIKNSKFYDSGKNSLNIKDGSSNGIVHHNEIYGTGYVYGTALSGTTTTGIYIDAQSQPISNIQIYSNSFHQISAAAIVLGSETDPHSSVTNIDIFNNQIYDNHQGFVIWSNPFVRTFRIVNNTFYNNLSHIAIYGDTGTNQDCLIRNNIIAGTYDNQNLINYKESQGVITIDYNLFYNPSGTYRISQSNLSSNNIKAAPVFVNPSIDFSIDSTSPANGTATITGAPVTDFAGTLRDSILGFDIGAFETAAPPQLQPVVSIESATNQSEPGEPAEFTVTVSSASPAPTPTGTVTFIANDSQISVKTLIDGQASLSTTELAVGTYSISARYSGDTTYEECSAPSIIHTVLPTAKIQESYYESSAIDCIFSKLYKAQTFTPLQSHNVETVRVQLLKTGDPAGNVEVCIRLVGEDGLPAGEPIAVTSIPASQVTRTLQWHQFSFNGDFTLESGNQYALCFSAPGADSLNRVWYQVDTTGAYLSGNVVETYSAGIVWKAIPAYDAVFEITGR